MSSPLTLFEIEKLIGLDAPLFGSSIYITNNSFYLLISVAAMIVLYLQSNDILGHKLIPSNLALVGESLYISLLAMSRKNASNQAVLPFIVALFTIILMANLVSNIPYNYASTSALTFTLGLSFTIFIGVTVWAISHKNLSFLATFVPSGTPAALLPMLTLIELISYCARAISLGVRLFANIVAGHSLLSIISTMSGKMMFAGISALLVIPIVVSLESGLVGLEVAVAFIQAYVFTVLTTIYMDESEKPL